MFLNKKVMISQPMYGLSDAEIKEARDRAKDFIRQHRGDIVENLVDTSEMDKKDTLPLYCLAKSLEAMSHCDVVYFLEGWKRARGCRIEHLAAEAYNMQIIYEYR